MAEYYLGIDNGGTVCKAVVFDRFGREIAGAAAEMGVSTPQAGFTERDMNELWEINCQVIRQAVKKSKIPAGQIGGVACTGHGKGLYLWGKDEQPCYSGIVSTDTRAWEYPAKFEKQGTARRVFDRIYQEIMACHPVSLLWWLKDHEPQVIPKIKWIFSVKDYIRFRLTGQAFAEITDCSGSGLLNIKDKSLDPSLLREYGLEHLFPALPPLKGLYRHLRCSQPAGRR